MMKDKKIEVIIASPPERDDLVIQYFEIDGGQWAELFKEDSEYKIEFYQKENGEPWGFDFEEVIKCLELGKEELMKRIEEKIIE